MKEKVSSGSNKIQVYHDFITPQGHKIRLGFEEGRLFAEYSGQKTYYTNANGKIAIDELYELTSGSGIVIDGITIKDGQVGNLCVNTIKKTIGGVDIAGCDFNFATAANTTEQSIDLGAIIPARARILDIYLVTDAVFTGATTLVADVGNASGGAQFITSATIYAKDVVLAGDLATIGAIAPNVAASKVWLNATPGANWSNVTAGKVSVYISYIDVANI